MNDAKMVVLKTNDEITTIPYKEYKDLRKVVEGNIEFFMSEEIKLDGKLTRLHFICNECFLIDDDISSVNALMTVYGTDDTIYGNVAIVKNKVDDIEGLTNKEAKELVSILKNTIGADKGLLASIHRSLDNNKPKLTGEFIPLM